MRSLTLVVSLFAAGTAWSQPASSSAWATTVSGGFQRYEKAWAAYQLKTATDLYGVGEQVVAVPPPAIAAALFGEFKFPPASVGGQQWSVQAQSGTSIRICLSATVANENQLAGFVAGLRTVNAVPATATCQPAMLAGRVQFPAQVGGLKEVRAVRAGELIAKDEAFRAEQAQAADAVTFNLPPGRLLDFRASPGGTSAPSHAAVTNSATLAWLPLSLAVDGPFTASHNCLVVLSGATCTVSVRFVPTRPGKQEGMVSLATSSGRTLKLRLAGLGS